MRTPKVPPFCYSRRSLLLAAAVALASPFALAQGSNWPSKPVTVVVPFPAGGGTDAFARPLTAVLSKNLGKQFIIDNKGGAGGTLGAGVAARAAPDGHTLVLCDVGALAITASVYSKMPFDPSKDLRGVTMLAYSPHLLVVHPSVAANNLAELVALSQSVGSLCLFAAPTMVKRLVEHIEASGTPSDGFKTIVYGGGPMYGADIQRALAVMGPRFVQIYGQGESPMTITALSRAYLGDAAHPLRPYLAQGAAMAIEDAWTLGQLAQGQADRALAEVARLEARAERLLETACELELAPGQAIQWFAVRLEPA